MATVKAQPMSSERKKLLFLASLLLLFVAVAVWNLTPSRKRSAPPPPTNKAGRVRNADLAAGRRPQPDAGSESVPVGDGTVYGPVEPLPLVMISASAPPANARNIFAYPPPPPPPPVKAPVVDEEPPPPIPIGNVSPSTVIAGSSKPLSITVSGNHIPVDAKVLWNGQALESQWLSRNMVRATVPPSAFSSPRSVVVEVKSASQPDRLFSKKLPFQLTPSPDPGETFTYTGRVGSQAVITIKDVKRPKLVTVGETLNGAVPWKILAINDRQVDMLDTRNEIRKSLALAAKASK